MIALSEQMGAWRALIREAGADEATCRHVPLTGPTADVIMRSVILLLAEKVAALNTEITALRAILDDVRTAPEIVEWTSECRKRRAAAEHVDETEDEAQSEERVGR